MITLGISAFFHDSAAALVVDGHVVAAAQEERFSRLKHDYGFPKRAIAFVLEQAGLSVADVDSVVFYENPLKKFERIVLNQLRVFPRGLRPFVHATRAWLGGRLWTRATIAETLDVDPTTIVFGDHHASHAASVFHSHACEHAAVVVVDGVGEFATTTIFDGTHDDSGCPRLTPLCALHFPHSIGLFYSALTAYLGFQVNRGEYKVMGLASYGRPIYVDTIKKTLSFKDDGSLTLDLRYFCFDRHRTKSFAPALERLLGAARDPAHNLRLGDDDSCAESQRFADIAASLQAILEEYLLVLCRHAAKETGADTLCLSGGVALNSVAMRRLADEAGFRRLLLHPAAGDAGGAVGAALLHDVERRRQPPAVMASSALGGALDPRAVERFFSDCRIPHESFAPQSEALADAIAQRLARGDVGGLCCGRAEWGPRALGQRSILADPRRVEAKLHVNAKIKFREAFRPFAPSVLEEDADEWFEPSAGADDRSLRRTMSTVARATERAKNEIPAVVHHDDTARLQSVPKASDSMLRSILEAFKARTGVGVLLNTSMNLRGEPMVQSAADAYALFLRSDLDFVVVEGCLIDRTAK